MTNSASDWYVRPVFFVADCEAALAFYRQLGFRESWRFDEGGRVLVAQVARNGFELILNRREDRPGGGRVFFSIGEQVDACVAAFTSAGIVVKDGHWGMPIKMVSDPDGNELFFACQKA